MESVIDAPVEEPVAEEEEEEDDGLRRLSVAVRGSAVKLRPEGIVEGADSAILVAARNEFESFQVAINAPEEPLEGLTVSLRGPLRGPGGAVIAESYVTVYRVGYYPVKTPSDLEGAPGPWPDPLIPAVDPIMGEARNAFPVDVPVGENRVAWIDVQVPMNARPGTYTGRLDVRAEGHSARVPIQLTVLDFTLPSTTSLKGAFGLNDHLCAWMGFEGCSDAENKARVKQHFLRTGLDNRITISDAHSVMLRPGDDKALRAFRTYTLPFVQGTAPTRLPGARLTAYQVNRHKNRQVTEWRDEIKAQGFEDRAFIYACDEPHFFPVYEDPAGNWRLCLEELAAQHALWPEAPKVVTTHIQSSSKHHSTHLFDIMVLNVELLDGPVGTRWYVGDQRPLYDDFLADLSRPKELWLYTACGSHGCSRNDDPYTIGWAGYEIDAPASQHRAMAWLAFSYRATGTLYYDMAAQLETAWDDQYRMGTGNGEGNLFYPGTPDRIGGKTPIPIESLRMKLIRDGYEDYEYLKFLQDNGMGAEAHRVARALYPTAYRTTRTDEEIQAARLELAAMVARITGGPMP